MPSLHHARLYRVVNNNCHINSKFQTFEAAICISYSAEKVWCNTTLLSNIARWPTGQLLYEMFCNTTFCKNEARRLRVHYQLRIDFVAICNSVVLVELCPNIYGLIALALETGVSPEPQPILAKSGKKGEFSKKKPHRMLKVNQQYLVCQYLCVWLPGSLSML